MPPIGMDGYIDEPGDETCSLADVARVVGETSYMIDKWKPHSMMLGVIGEPKAMKSMFVLLGVIKPLVTGEPFFNGQRGHKPCKVMLVDTENSKGVILDRCRRFGIPLDNIVMPLRDPLESFSLENDAHMVSLLNAVCKYQTPEVVIDSFRGGHGLDENSSKIVAPLKKLGEMCERTKAAISIIHHTKKMDIGEDMTINSGRGSNAFLAAVRVQWAIDRPDPDSEWRRVQMMGENLGLAPEPLGFRLTDTGLEYGPAPQRKKKSSQKDKAGEWLREIMEPGTYYLVTDLNDRGLAKGFNPKTIQRAAEAVGVQSKATREGGKVVRWEWVLPKSE